MMRFGFSTILWGRRIDDLDHLLDVVQACGFQGVEIAQHHKEIFIRDGSSLRRQLTGITELKAHLAKRNLELIGLVCGNLRDRADFLEGVRSPYLYADHSPDKSVLRSLLDQGFQIALHPHWLMPIGRFADALDIVSDLSRFGSDPGKLGIILDTAHTVIGEDDPVEIFKEYSSKLMAIHLKGWRPDYGRWSHRYAHGFCLPSADGGIALAPEVLGEAIANSFRGWIIMEQDHYDIAREETCLRCARWLNAELPDRLKISVEESRLQALTATELPSPYVFWGQSPTVEEILVDVINKRAIPKSAFHFHTGQFSLSGPLSELILGRDLSRKVSHRPDPDDFYATTCLRVSQVFAATCVKIWAYNPNSNLKVKTVGPPGELVLVGIHAPDLDLSHSLKIIRNARSIIGTTLENPVVTQLDLREKSNSSRYADQHMLPQLESKSPWLLTIPVFNTSNTHQLRFIISVSTATPVLDPTATNAASERNTEKLGQIDSVSWLVSHWSNYLTDEICSAAAGHTNHICGQLKSDVVSFLDKLRTYISEAFKCRVTFFLEDITGERLKPSGSSCSQVEWGEHPHYYSDADSQSNTFMAWRGRKMVFSSQANSGTAREHRSANDGDRNEILFAPLLRRKGKCHGVVRLSNKEVRQGGVSSMFTDDDAAKLDAIIQTALPHLELLKAQEQQRFSMALAVHELSHPVVAINSAVSKIRRSFQKRKVTWADTFDHDYSSDITDWTAIMSRLVRNISIFAVEGGINKLQIEKTFLRRDVILPVIKQIKPVVPKRVDFDVQIGDFRSLPALFIDKGLLQQVIFNLISNCIKYRNDDESILVDVNGDLVGNSYCIFVEDWGSGIEDVEKDEIFFPGHRGSSALGANVAGQGLGLYVVRTILRAFGGRIEVRSLRNPTSFEIILPRRLRHDWKPPFNSTIAPHEDHSDDR